MGSPGTGDGATADASHQAGPGVAGICHLVSSPWAAAAAGASVDARRVRPLVRVPSSARDHRRADPDDRPRPCARLCPITGPAPDRRTDADAAAFARSNATAAGRPVRSDARGGRTAEAGSGAGGDSRTAAITAATTGADHAVNATPGRPKTEADVIGLVPRLYRGAPAASSLHHFDRCSRIIGSGSPS